MPLTSLHLANRTLRNCILITVLHANEYFCSWVVSVRLENGFSRGFPFEDKFVVGIENSSTRGIERFGCFSVRDAVEQIEKRVKL